MNRLERVKTSLLRLSLGNYSEFTVGQCVDYIAWLAKFRKLPKDDIDFLLRWAHEAMALLDADEEEAFWEEYRIRKEQGRI